MVGNMQANEVLKNILNLKNELRDKILIIDLLNLSFRQANFSKKRIAYVEKGSFFIFNFILYKCFW